MKKILILQFLFCIIFVFSSEKVIASGDFYNSLNFLSNSVNDDRKLSSKWSLSCSQEWLSQQGIRNGEDVLKLTRLIAFYGLERVRKINPILARAIHARLENESITISCSKEIFSENSKSLASASAFQIVIFGNVFANKFIDIRNVLLNLTHYEGVTVDHFNSIFHELLHLAKVDNLFAKYHNTHEAESKDVVYGCAEYAFNRHDKWSKTFVNACLVCSLAEVNGAKTKVNWKDSKRVSMARLACQKNI